MLAPKLPILKIEVEKGVRGLVGGTQTSRLLRLGAVGAQVWEGVLLDVLIKIVLFPVDGVSFEWPWVVDRWRSMCHVSLGHGGHS